MINVCETGRQVKLFFILFPINALLFVYVDQCTHKNSFALNTYSCITHIKPKENRTKLYISLQRNFSHGYYSSQKKDVKLNKLSSIAIGMSNRTDILYHYIIFFEIIQKIVTHGRRGSGKRLVYTILVLVNHNLDPFIYYNSFNHHKNSSITSQSCIYQNTTFSQPMT